MKRLAIGLFRKRTEKTITFIKCLDVSDEFQPIPAKDCLPEWYKKQQSYIDQKKRPDGSGNTTATIKKCMPVFDAMSAGYIIFSPVDLYVSRKEDGQTWYEWPSLDIITFHSKNQADKYPSTQISFPKWTNAWGIKTEPGYSVLFINPMHHDSPIRILEGIVDCDQYVAPVNFPFILADENFEGLIPAGTPIAQVIPFPRTSYKMEILFDSRAAHECTRNLKSKFFDSYKIQFWKKKEYS